MNPAPERIAKTLASRARKAQKYAQTGSEVAPTTGSGDSSSAQATINFSPTVVSSKVKRPRLEGIIDLTGVKGKRTYKLPLTGWRRISSRAHLPRDESLHLEGLGRPEKTAMLAQDAGGLMRILEMVVAYIGGSSFQEAELKNLRAKLAASEKARIEEEKARKLSDE